MGERKEILKKKKRKSPKWMWKSVLKHNLENDLLSLFPYSFDLTDPSYNNVRKNHTECLCQER
jgi:hypothetical protein